MELKAVVVVVLLVLILLPLQMFKQTLTMDVTDTEMEMVEMEGFRMTKTVRMEAVMAAAVAALGLQQIINQGEKAPKVVSGSSTSPLPVRSVRRPLVRTKKLVRLQFR